MRDTIERAKAPVRSYWKIESVVLSFGNIELRDAPNTLILRAVNAGLDYRTPFRVQPIYVGAAGKEAVDLPDFWLDIWSCATRPAEQAIAEITAAAVYGTSVLLNDTAFTTQIDDFEGVIALHGAGPLNGLCVLEKLNEFSWMRCSGFRPAWYSDELHGDAFGAQGVYNPAEEIQDYFDLLFSGPGFERKVVADELVRSLQAIPEGSEGATRFHRWVADAIALIFADDLERVRMHPNGNAVERRDIVATNAHRNLFWRLLYWHYRVSMPVFEAKNYPDPGCDAFRQVYSYLARHEHGEVGFLVARKIDCKLEEATLKHFREFYNVHRPGKLVIFVPSAMLVKCLLDVTHGRGQEANGIMAAWFEDFLLKHAYE
jgi:hypothetical protein